MWYTTFENRAVNLANATSLDFASHDRRIIIAVFQSRQNAIAIEKCATIEEAIAVREDIIKRNGGFAKKADAIVDIETPPTVQKETKEQRVNTTRVMINEGYTQEYIAKQLDVEVTTVAKYVSEIEKAKEETKSTDEDQATLDELDAEDEIPADFVDSTPSDTETPESVEDDLTDA